MNKKLQNYFGIAFILILSTQLSAQTPGTLTFSYIQAQPNGTTVAPAMNAGLKNITAVWIENNAGLFIKTKYRFVSSVTQDHLPTWAAKSGGVLSNALSANCNVTDAVTGATRTSVTVSTATAPAAYVKANTLTWDGKNVSGAANGVVVPDGIYKVWIESTWNDTGGVNYHNVLTSFAFTKGTTVQHVTPVGDAFFNTIVMDWVPVLAGVDSNTYSLDVNVYPNPSNGLVNLDFNSEVTFIKVSNLLGQEIYSEKISESTLGTSKSVDLSAYEAGVYIVNVSNNDGGVSNYKVVLDK
jgi:Secretion system C-terminal sorting domain